MELFGCTSAGKSSFGQRIVRSSRELGMDAALSEEFVLRRARLDWIHAVWVRRLLVDLLSAAACLRAWGRNREFFRLVVRTISSLRPAVAWPERLNIARNVFKKVGIREIIHRKASARQLVVMDEGTLKTAHYLFVQRCAEPDPAELLEFLKSVPLPDVAVYLREEEETLVRRTLARGHKRIPDRSDDTTVLFMKRALCTLDGAANDERVKRRLIAVDAPMRSAASAAISAGPEVAEALEIARAATAEAGALEAD
jgi:adenylate kinase family enzyme